MKTIEIEKDNRTTKIMLISHRFVNYPNVVCSGSKIYQLPCQIGKKTFAIKELKPKYHQGLIVYLINSKRVNSKKLKIYSKKVDERFIISTENVCPF